MTDWSDAVRAYASEHPRTPALDIARELGCTETDAMIALSEVVAELPVERLEAVLAGVRGWGQVLALVRNTDAVAEVEVPGDGCYLRNGWLNWITDAYNLHIRVASLARLLALTRPGMHGTTYSLNFVNDRGEIFFRLYARTEEAQERFEELYRPYLPREQPANAG